jgi:hypothetical protein
MNQEMSYCGRRNEKYGTQELMNGELHQSIGYFSNGYTRERGFYYLNPWVGDF